MKTTYSDASIKTMAATAKDAGVNFVLAEDRHYFIRYINSKSLKSDKLSAEHNADPISQLIFFGHGEANVFASGYGQPWHQNSNLRAQDVIQLIEGSAFSETGSSEFWSCFPGDPEWKGMNMVQTFKQIGVSHVMGFTVRSYYKFMNDGESRWDKVRKSIWGFDYEGAKHYPIPYKDDRTTSEQISQ